MTADCMADMLIDLIKGMVARLPDEIVEAVKRATANMNDLIKRWAQLIKMISQLKEDAGRVGGVSPTFDGKVVATLEHVIHDLDSHDRVVSWHNLTEAQLHLCLLTSCTV